MHQTSTVYIDPNTGALSASAITGAEAFHGIISGVTGPIALRCSLHGRYHQVESVTTAFSGRSGLDALEDFIRVTLAAVCTTCAEWKQAWHQTSVAFDHLSWCLVCCQRHGWEYVASLAEPDGRARAALVDLGSVLIAQAVETCDEFTVTHDVLHRELAALPVRDAVLRPGASTRPTRPMAAMRFYQDAAAAFARAMGDIGYVVARALEALAD